ncbi:MAG: glycosyltransferase [bacterium]|jgi:GT2 family glycosyltransferase
MISIVYSTRTPNKQFQDHIKKTIGVKDYEIVEIVNNGEKSLTQCYNHGLDVTKNNITVFCHDDIILSDNWGKKVVKHFENTDFGILGKAGTTDIPSIGRWWEDTTKMIGIVSHSHEGRTWENRYSSNFEGDVIETVMLDGLFFVVHKERIKERFDENIKGFHFYDIDFTFNNHLNGVKVGVMFDFKITHKSIGMTNDEWEKNRLQFAEKYKDKLPYNIVPEIKVDFKEVKLKETPKISVIIPTKGNVHLLKQCINSIVEQNPYDNLKVYIADTGSTPEEKEEIKSTYGIFNKIKLIEYDFYNFAVINNDVVENHVDKDTELLLFCNNDIKVINNAISKMVDVYLKNKKTVGTIGARLHFGDNTIQHSGIIMFLDQNRQIRLSHHGLRSYYSYHKEMTRDVFGNTAAFMMMSKKLFDDIGGFNTSYRECFEDVELNIECINRGKENIFVGDAVCYHYESQTRNKSEEKLKKEGEDYTKRLIPFIINNKKSYNYFNNVKAKDFEMLLQQAMKNNEVRNFV